MGNRLRIFWVIHLSLLIGLLLMIFPLPDWAEPFRPDWVALILIYWCMSLPIHAGLGTALALGLLLDVAMGTLLGQHALGLTAMSYIILKNHQRFRLYPPIQQSIIVMFVLLVKQLLFLWIYGITNRAPASLFVYFMPSVVSMLLWPWIAVVMRDIQYRFLPAHHR